MAEQHEYRYADGPSAEVTAVIDADPADLWQQIIDVNLSARYSSEFQGGEWLDGATEPALGARFRGTNEHPRVGRWQVECTIVELEPEGVLGWEVGGADGEPAAAWRFTLEPVDGGTRVTQWCRLGPGRSGLNPAIEAMPDREHEIIERRLGELQGNMQKNLDGLADLAASGGS